MAGQKFTNLGQKTGTKDRDTLARARPSYGGDVPSVPRDNAGGTRDREAGQGQPYAYATGRPSPFGATENCRTREGQKQRFAADPRFAAWVAGMPAAEPSAADVRRFEEQRELKRIAYQRVVDDHEAGRAVDPITLQCARLFLRTTPPLGRALGTGEPE